MVRGRRPLPGAFLAAPDARPTSHPQVPHHWVQAAAHRAQILAVLTVPMTPREIRTATGLSVDRVHMTVYALKRRGLIQVVGKRPRPTGAPYGHRFDSIYALTEVQP
jgi:hypothetical protein